MSTRPPPGCFGSPVLRSARTTLLAVAAVVALVVSAYGLGTLFPEGDGEQRETARGSGPSADATAVSVEDGAGIADVEASCIDAPSRDAAGRPTSYEPALVADGDPATAWRCSGNGRGAALRILLDETRTISRVGLIPGYAKTDPVDGTDRYAQNRRLVRVRWTFSDGTSLVQVLSTDPKDRRMQSTPVPSVDASSVRLEILASTPAGERDAVAISEVLLQ